MFPNKFRNILVAKQLCFLVELSGWMQIAVASSERISSQRLLFEKLLTVVVIEAFRKYLTNSFDQVSPTPSAIPQKFIKMFTTFCLLTILTNQNAVSMPNIAF